MQEHLVERKDLEESLRQWTKYRNVADIIVVPISFITDGKQITATHFLVYMK